MQVTFETDVAFARGQMAEIARGQLGAEMADGVAAYREALAETPVELEGADGPAVNVHRRETWVELRLRSLVPPRGMQRHRNELYEAILARFDEHPDRVGFPVGRAR